MKKEIRLGCYAKNSNGTRDAAHNWVEEVARFLKALVFKRGRYNPCLYLNSQRKIELRVHGDDFMSVGSNHELKWLADQMKKRFQIKTSIVGGRTDEEKEVRVLNRVIRWTADGWQCEHDQRHSGMIVHELGLDGAKPMETPGEKPKAWEM